MEKVELGDRVKDVVTGLTGIVIGITQWITGCDSASVSQGMLPDGKPADLVGVDVTRLEIVTKGAVKLPQQDKPAAKSIGGPIARF